MIRIAIIFCALILSGCNTLERSNKDYDNNGSLISITNTINTDFFQKDITEDTANKDLNRYAWEDFKEKISEEEYYALIKYIPLFDENKEFYCFPLEKKCSLQSLKTLFEVDNYWVWDFSLIDMDGNEEMEIVITTSLGPGITFVISEIDDEYYGSYYSSREMSNLQKNGTFVGSGSASNQKFSKLSITKEGFETRIFEEKSGWGDESNWTEDYYEQFMEENYSDPIEWNKLNLEIR